MRGHKSLHDRSRRIEIIKSRADGKRGVEDFLAWSASEVERWGKGSASVERKAGGFIRPL